MTKRFKPALACLMFFALFLSAYVCVYSFTRSSLVENTLKSVDECLTSTAADINSYIDDTVATVRRFNTEPRVQSLYVNELNAKTFADFIELKKFLNLITIRSGSLLDIALVYDTAKPFAVSSKAVYHDLNSGTLSIEGGQQKTLLELARSSVSNAVNRRPTDVVRLNTAVGAGEVTMLVYNIARYSGGSVYALVTVSADALLNAVHGTCTYGSPCALMRGDETIYGDAPKAGKSEYVSVSLPAMGLKAVFRVTEEEITERLKPFTSLLIILLAVFIVSAAGVLGVIVYSTLTEQRRSEQAKAELTKLDGEARELRQSLDAVSPMLRDTLFHKLLSVGYLSPVERSAFLSYFSLKADAPCRFAVIGSNALPSAALTEKLAGCLKEKLTGTYAFAVYRGKCVIMTLSHLTDAECVSRIKELISGFETEGVCAGVSPEMLSVLSPVDAYRISENALHSAAPGECALAYSEASPVQIRQPGYAQLNSLYEQIQAGSPKASDAFEALVNEVLSDDLSGINRRRTFERFYEDMRALLSRVYSAGEYLPELELPPFDSSAEQPYVLLGMLRHMVAGAVEQAASRSVNSRNELASTVKLYVDEHIGNPDLSLTLLGEVFGMSESAMSRFFKANIGENFASYMESMRINEAVKLLGSTTLPVSEVAQAVGYASVTTFYKAFKRRTGSAPSQARV